MKNKRKFVALMLALVLVLTAGLTGCGGSGSSGSDSTGANTTTDATTDTSGNDATASDTASEDRLLLGVSQATLELPWNQAWETGFKEECDRLGIDYIVLDAGFDVLKQDQQMAQLIEQEPDVLLVNPVDPQSMGARIKEAYDKGIPILNSEAIVDESLQDMVTYVGFASWDSPDNALKMIDEALDGEARIISVLGLAGNAIHEEKRIKPSNLEAYPGITVIDEQYTDCSRSDAEEKMANMLTKWGPDDFDVVYAQDDNSLQGAITAMEARGYNPSDYVLVSGAYFSSNLELIKNGTQYGTSLIDPRIQAVKAIEVAIQMANGEEVDPQIVIPLSIVTADNVDGINATW